MKTTIRMLFAVSLFALPLAAAEPHADLMVRDILENVAKVKKASPDAVPMAFWDFDGTIICGDISTGHEVDGKRVYSGMFVESAGAGFSGVIKTKEQAQKFLEEDYVRMGKDIGRWLAWPVLGQLFHGADAAALEAYCRDYAVKTLKPWYFTSTIRMMRALEKAGVENYIVSGSPDVFVKAAGEAAGVPRHRSVGIRQRIAGGRLTVQLEYPLSMNEGKIECVREVLNSRAGAVAVAAFGNSYWTDGPFMRYVVTNPLPGGAKGLGMMINGGKPPKGYEGLFRCVKQSETSVRYSGI